MIYKDAKHLVLGRRAIFQMGKINKRVAYNPLSLNLPLRLEYAIISVSYWLDQYAGN